MRLGINSSDPCRIREVPVHLTGVNLTNEDIILKWYRAWEKKDLGKFDNLLADDFTFSSAAGGCMALAYIA